MKYHPLKSLTQSLNKLVHFRSSSSKESLNLKSQEQHHENQNNGRKGSSIPLDIICSNGEHAQNNVNQQQQQELIISNHKSTALKVDNNHSDPALYFKSQHIAQENTTLLGPCDEEERDTIAELDSSVTASMTQNSLEAIHSYKAFYHQHHHHQRSGSIPTTSSSLMPAPLRPKIAKSLPKLNSTSPTHKKSASTTPQMFINLVPRVLHTSHDKVATGYTTKDGNSLQTAHGIIPPTHLRTKYPINNSMNDMNLVCTKTTALSLYEVSTPSTSCSLSDLQAVKKIGEGGFATVFLVRERRSQQYFALKALKKSLIIKMKQDKQIINEKLILSSLQHPMIVSLYSTFQDDTYLYMMLEYVAGGDLFTYLRKVKKLTESAAKFYGASVVLAIEYLHQQSIIYRDLKPENILLDTTGNIKLTDFGFAKRIVDTTSSFCGTPDYIAMEIVEGSNYSHSVDWWSVGVLLFEMISGRTPFFDVHVKRIYDNIENLRIQWDEKLSPPVKDLIKRLIIEKKSRLDAKGIRKHIWFREIDWDKLQMRCIAPPYIPAAEPLEKLGVTERIVIKEPEHPMTVEMQKQMMILFRNF